MKYIYAFFILLLALFLAAFIQQNGQLISLKYFSWSTPALPLSLYVILAFAAGYVLAVIVGFSSGIRSRIRTAGAEREVKKLRSELEDLNGGKVEQADPAPVAQPASEPATVSSVEKSEASPMKGVSPEELRRALEEDEEEITGDDEAGEEK
jgi:uncharacterized integral membrane protein